jgi:hypothetical protein
MDRERWKPATHLDILDVAKRIREVDNRECKASIGVDALSYLPLIDPSNTYAILNSDGKNFALAGVSPLQFCDLGGQIWMVATDDIKNHKIEFLKYSQSFIKHVMEPYDYVMNWVDARNELHIQWLKWCGFVFLKKHTCFGAEGIPFYEFIKVK